ncbi:S-methyl-5-thioribose-1-phosphate isomerase [Xylella taiwanensis]|nr:S-methyl-5-thioribose-1-phosphate isomerase [Xylella taiwanensis]AXI84248.1 methylthioribose-1-phosphate isomerase [Xylella taiwanensis]MCD8457366.1 S-methyl-5-thioribose-1-phosphate isomerase [Xylella taiwanensis]MCD8457524.1 S-methyl-5-thioribose-1-phosphate isomerase [Xylella taiwanensis]MCD8461352.1 S-methyl-5-thioribose-1-phosphate isomerase [Xylella taiwanensis]MCD8462615.1 S-methyl-5-thioribose-1-phosphate isomerase [Xylella taiwanensis]
MYVPTAIDDAPYDQVRPILWTGEVLKLLDQRKLPFAIEYVQCHSSAEVTQAIRALIVRGAPAIGIVAGWGAVLAAREIEAADGIEALRKLEPAFQSLHAARPTAVNLAWVLARMRRTLAAARSDWREVLACEAAAIAEEDLAANRRMGALGAALIPSGSGVLTHCNTGSLATAGFGTALGVIRAGVAQGRIARVFAGETRPWLQGARLTVWELQQDGIDATLIADSAAAYLMQSGLVQWVVVGADRICANGDTANKIGTYQLAIAARYHGVKFMVVASSVAVDMETAAGEAIEIEQRDAGELLGVSGVRTVAEGINAWNPVFDVTPGALIDAIVTERGVIHSPDTVRMRTAFLS